MEQDMADKPSNPRSQRKKQSAADRLLTGANKDKVELTEDELKKVSGGDIRYRQAGVGGPLLPLKQ
jgi:bacteriocin-like protein